jgi:hypothetical protein
MRRPVIRWNVMLLGAAALFGAPAQASLLVALDTPTMVAEADTIAVVDVTRARAAWDARHERIVTTVDLAVVESWKGAAAPAARVQIVQPGGTVGDITMIVHGLPRFAPGERALVFLRGPRDRASVVGLAQGKRLVRREGANGTARYVVAAPDRAGASFVRAPGAAAAAPAARLPISDTATRPLDEVRAEVQALVARGGAR